MEHETDEFYENVVFRDSRIIYPLDLAAAASSTTPTGDPPDDSRPSRVRPSVLEAFDPAYGFYTHDSSDKDVSNSLNLLLLEDINLNFGTASEPPPIPPRNVSCPPVPLKKERYNTHQYDSVALEDESFSAPSSAPVEEYPVNHHINSTSLVSIISSASTSNEKNEQHLPPYPVSPTTKNNSRVRGLLSKIYTTEWLKSRTTNVALKEETNYGLISKGQATEIGICDMILWSSITRKDSQPLWTELKNGVLSSFLAQKPETPVHVIKLNSIVSIGQPITSDGSSDSLSFELTPTKEKNKILLSVDCSERKVFWMKQILMNCMTGFCPILLQCYLRAGKCYAKASVSGEWQPTWLLLHNQPYKKLWLHHVGPDGTFGPLTGESLHKVRSVSWVKLGDIGGCSLAIQPGRFFIVNWFDHTLYIQCDLRSETENWYHLLRSVALVSGSSLEDQQMTPDDAPVLVECCIKYIETYGILSEGIYRRSGVQSKIQRLLQRLKSDAWNQYISTEEFSEHDVANVLKRFFRTLPEPLLTNELYSQWIDGLNSANHEEQLELYKRLLNMLPHVNRCTLRKLLGHLHVVQNKCEKNLMSVSNLAALWGPNLMTVDSSRNDSSNFG